MSLVLEDVTTYLQFGRELKSVILHVDLQIEPAEIVGLVGESGSGKSMTARTIAGVLPRGAVTEGRLLLGGENLLEMPRRKRREVQAKEIGFVFQDPRAYIDPLWRVEVHLTEAMRVHLGLSRSEARGRAIELLDSVGIDQPERRMRQFPDELSGGMLQRVMIAGALAMGPSVLLADEATTALDVTTQAGNCQAARRPQLQTGSFRPLHHPRLGLGRHRVYPGVRDVRGTNSGGTRRAPDLRGPHPPLHD